MKSKSHTSQTGIEYSSVSSEYYEEKLHPTCHNFNQLSRNYVAAKFSTVANRIRVLEVGAGRSTAAEIIHTQGGDLKSLEITDINSTMLAHSERWQSLGAKLSVADARALPVQNSCISVLIAGLGDPYNTPSFWNEAFRVLAPEGRILFTTPSFEWAAAFRKLEGAPPNCAKFALQNGQTVLVPSLIGPLGDQIEIIERAGLTVSNFEALGRKALLGASVSPKISMIGDNLTSIVWGFTAEKSPQDAPTASTTTRLEWKKLFLENL